MTRLAVWTACAQLAWSSDGTAELTGPNATNDPNKTNPGQNDADLITDIAARLNGEIAGSGGAYTAGKGVLVRTPDFFTGSTQVVPATLWSNDIFSPSQNYPATVDPMCPTNGDGWSQLTKDCGGKSPWDRANVAVVISSDMPNLFTEWNSIQSEDWGWGVFYPFDANAADKRCHWREDWNGWDCPGGFIDADSGTYTDDPTKGGAGAYRPGNPYVNNQEGGGAGCHVDTGVIDQMDAGGDMNLVQDQHCQCNYAFNDDWYHWVHTWMEQGYQKPGLEWRGWFAGGKAPTWGVDASICWVSNFRDMISLQNALYWHSTEWNNQLMPQSNWGSGSADDRIYWGWNEVPVETSRVDDPANWDSIIIKLPADICGNGGGDDHVECMGGDQLRDLHDQLKSFEDAGKLLKGIDHVTDRPGSYILFVREYRVDDGWARYFFCRNAVLQDREIKTEYEACFYDDHVGPAPPDPTPDPTPPPPSSGSCCWGGSSCDTVSNCHPDAHCGASEEHCTGECAGLWCPKAVLFA